MSDHTISTMLIAIFYAAERGGGQSCSTIQDHQSSTDWHLTECTTSIQNGEICFVVTSFQAFIY